MLKCPKCGDSFPEPYRFCPLDGVGLEANGPDAATVPQPAARGAAVVEVRTLFLSVAILFGAGGLSFGGFFLYQYLKPKHGTLVVKTTPPGAMVFVNNQQRGVSPLTLGDLRTGGYQVKASKEGYKEFIQRVEILPYATEDVHFSLEPLVAHLTNEQLAEVEAWRKKLDTAQKEKILLPPPEDYNVLYFANRILAIDPANSHALEVKNKLAESVRHSADLAYAREDWLEAEDQYKNLALIFPNDLSIGERLTDIAAKIEASVRDRDKQIEDWKSKAEAAIQAGNLVPPEKDNAFDALRNILRLDRKNAYALGQLPYVKEIIQNRGDTKIGAGDYQGARNEFRTVLLYFPDDNFSKSRLTFIEGKLAELAQTEQQQQQRAHEEQQSRERIAGMRQSALAAFRNGAWAKTVSDWQEYLKYEPNSDEAFYCIGVASTELRQFDTAILNLERSLSINPGSAQAHLNLGLLYDRHRGDVKKAEEHLRRARELGGTEKYGADRLQSMIQELQNRAQLAALRNTPFAAEHRHVFSSCRGTLRISTEGVEYRTTDTDHSFFEPYGGLNSLRVDGDEVTMRTRNNKKYTFSLLGKGDAEKVRMLAAPHLLSQ